MVRVARSSYTILLGVLTSLTLVVMTLGASSASATTRSASETSARARPAIHNTVGVPAKYVGTYEIYRDGSPYGQFTLTIDGNWTSSSGLCNYGAWLVLNKTMALSDLCSTFTYGGTWLAKIHGKDFGSASHPGIGNAPFYPPGSWTWYATPIKEGTALPVAWHSRAVTKAKDGPPVHNTVGVPAKYVGSYNYANSLDETAVRTLTIDGNWSETNFIDEGSWLVLGKTIAFSDIEGGTDGGIFLATIHHLDFGSATKPGIVNFPFVESYTWYATRVTS